MEIVKCWCVYRRNDGYGSLYIDRARAVFEARALHPRDRRRITDIFETFAAIKTVDGFDYLEPVWPDEVSGVSTFEGLPGGESVDAAELADIIKNGRGL